MSLASTPPGDAPQHRIERWQPWLAAVGSVLVHALLVLVAMLAPPITTTAPEGDAAGGSRVAVEFIGDGTPIPSPAPSDTPPASAPAEDAPAASRVQTTPVPRAEDPVPPVADVTADAPTPRRVPRPVPRQSAPSTSARPPPTSRRPGHTWGQPPGMAVQDLAPVNAGPARSAAIERGSSRGNASTAEPSLEVAGFQVVYDLRSERRLREWQAQGMTELFIPLPGTRRLMVCPLETALRRESGACRQLEPDSPELEAIGDAREVISVHQIYRQGEIVWRGPGAYR
ncbi:type II toxin-antitoxin system RelE/ParE family toxin [Luteimonas viscosa]|uniref:Type II toxin-antitoxin system RelE/ParE family toxin n=1 Tax=Luteimonas viscosa TaxID=1132694 RepID=A0A5D4XS78_9GAMM|nr:type II toxin-antitoxin system RelE/ParE family toxin [Luteimonas viscosa]TYT26611.1 type II toxin-antitoxin system RelE/ParE family toxin [Luteimonas viscosa]